MYKLIFSLCLLLASPAAYAERLNFAFGIGDSISSNDFSNSTYANLWAGTYAGRGHVSGWYASANIGASYWQSGRVAVDSSGQPIGSRTQHRPNFWVFSVGATKTLSNAVTVYAGPGIGHRNSTGFQTGATRFNFNAGVKYTIANGSVHLTADSANRGLSLAVGVRIF